jgi:hypothetical protein
MDYSTAHKGFLEATGLLHAGQTLNTLDASVVEKYNAWSNAPSLGGLHMILDLPAFAIVALITAVVFVGMKESRAMSNLLVIIKLLVIFLSSLSAPDKSLNLEKIIDRLVFIPKFEENSVKLSIQMNVFDNFMRKINAHLLIFPRDLINTTIPEGFLMWKIYYFFKLHRFNDSSKIENFKFLQSIYFYVRKMPTNLHFYFFRNIFTNICLQKMEYLHLYLRI